MFSKAVPKPGGACSRHVVEPRPRRRVNLPDRLLDVFPAGLFSMEEAGRRFERDLPEQWPDRPLWLCAADLRSGQRVVMGHPDGPSARLPDAIMASCAIPGVFPPVRLGRRLLVDGGVISSTNLDLATAAGCTFIVAVAPMALDPSVARPVTRLLRRLPERAVEREGGDAGRAGIETLLIRPTAPPLAEHGANLMKAAGRDTIARNAYDMTARPTPGRLRWPSPRTCSSRPRSARRHRWPPRCPASTGSYRPRT